MENQTYDRKSIKNAAKLAFNNDNVRWWMVLVNLIMQACTSAATSIGGVGGLFAAPLTGGLYYCGKDAIKDKKISLERLFDGYKGNWLRYVGAKLLIMLIVIAGTILLVIPGIIWSYAYSQTFYILAENPDMKATEAMAKSKEMMKGYKWRLFVLQLSFIGHIFLTLITCGIWGILVFSPYYILTNVNFFLYLKENQFDSAQIVE